LQPLFEHRLQVVGSDTRVFELEGPGLVLASGRRLPAFAATVRA
jgi:hypothetical protein